MTSYSVKLTEIEEVMNKDCEKTLMNKLANSCAVWRGGCKEKRTCLI